MLQGIDTEASCNDFSPAPGEVNLAIRKTLITHAIQTAAWERTGIVSPVDGRDILTFSYADTYEDCFAPGRWIPGRSKFLPDSSTSGESFELLDRLHGAGVEVVWVDPTIPSEGPLASIYMFLDSWRAGCERHQMVERSVRGKREKARRGKVVNPRSLPKWLRYNRDQEVVELDAEWAKVERLIFNLFAREGLKLRSVSRRLRRLGLEPPGSAPIWQPTTIRNLLSNPTAKGEMYQLRYQKTASGRSRMLRPRSEWIPLQVPATGIRASLAGRSATSEKE